jgi:nucleolar protein 56
MQNKTMGNKRKALISESPFGIFAFTEAGKLIYYEIPKTPSFSDKLKEYELVKDQQPLRQKFRELHKDLMQLTDEQLNKKIIEFCIITTRKAMKQTLQRDRLLIQATNAIEDLNKSISLFKERLEEWYGLYHPEFCAINFKKPENSTGINLTQEDEAALKSHIAFVQIAKKHKKELEKYVRDTVSDVAPNFSSLIDPLVAAKILSAAGSLEKLAKMTASSIQLIGAERALFRHLKKQGKPPKYGILFQDKHIQNAPENLRGKLARAIAAKLMLAARTDFYTKELNKKLKEDLEGELKKVIK